MRILVFFLSVMAIGLALGGVSAHLSIRQSHGLGAINVGPWSAWPFVGGAEVDPYTSARSTADGTLPLGAAEGLSFEATTDQNGDPLLQNCRYEIAGKTPITRVWTLAAYSDDGTAIEARTGAIAAFHSGNVVRFADSSFIIKIDDRPSSGNWMAIEGKDRFKLILRLYDTPITSNSGVIDPEMPKILPQGCTS
ncbi:MAG: DUF1214 domain-containing protein [Rhizobiaceae bacterium]|nr:DUF1214 domain-containing protein [Rhizobiaceae bacterium]